MVTADILQGIEEIKIAFPECAVNIAEDGSGGAYVKVDGVFIGTSYAPESTWIGFHMDFSYPDSVVYPHFMDSSVHRVDELMFQPPTPITMTTWRDISAWQISRAQRSWDRNVDTAAGKLRKVVEWLRII